MKRRQFRTGLVEPKPDLRSLDPHWHKRMPDHAFSFKPLPPTPFMALKLEIDPLNDGTIQCATVQLGRLMTLRGVRI